MTKTYTRLAFVKDREEGGALYLIDPNDLDHLPEGSHVFRVGEEIHYHTLQEECVLFEKGAYYFFFPFGLRHEHKDRPRWERSFSEREAV